MFHGILSFHGIPREGSKALNSWAAKSSSAQEPRRSILIWAATNTGVPLEYADQEIRQLKELSKEGLCRVFVEKNRSLNHLAADLIRYEPDIFHFIGHGDDRGNLIFNETKSSSIKVGPQDLIGLFEAAPHRQPHGLFLNACWTSVNAPHVTPLGGWLISMNSPVSDEIGCEFATSFYTRLFDPRNPASPKRALELAREDLLQGGAFPEELVQSYWFSDAGPVTIGKSFSVGDFISLVFNRGAFRVSAIDEVAMEALEMAIIDIRMALLTGQVVTREPRQTFLTVKAEQFEGYRVNNLFGNLLRPLEKLWRLVVAFTKDFPDFEFTCRLGICQSG